MWTQKRVNEQGWAEKNTSQLGKWGTPCSLCRGRIWNPEDVLTPPMTRQPGLWTVDVPMCKLQNNALE